MEETRAYITSRRSFVRRAAVALSLLIATACSSNEPKPGPATVSPRGTPAPLTPTPSLHTAEQMIHVNALDPRADDANSGAENQPLRTIRRAADLARENNERNIGTHVMVYPGVYRESIHFDASAQQTESPILFEAKEKDTAIISGSDIWDNWRRQGSTNLYTHPWPYQWGIAPYPRGWQGNITLPPIVRRREMIFLNSQLLTQVLTRQEMKEGTFCILEDTATVLLSPPSGASVERATIEVATRSGIFAVTGARNMTVRGLTFMHDTTPVNGTAVVFTDCSNILVEDCRFLWNNWCGLSFDSSATGNAHSMIARRNIANYNGGVGMEAYKVKEILYEANETSYNNWRGDLGGFYTWAVAGMKHLNIHGGIYRQHRAVENQACACWFDTDCANIEVDQAFCSRNFGQGLYIEASQGPVSATNCIIGHNRRAGGIFTEGGDNVTLKNNIIYGNAEVQVRILKGVRPVTDWETNENRVLIAEHWTAMNNIIVGTAANPRLVDIANGAQFIDTLNADNNCWFSPRKSDPFTVENTAMNFDTWRSVSEQDVHSQFRDPEFVNPDQDDFDLRDTSFLKAQQGR